MGASSDLESAAPSPSDESGPSGWTAGPGILARVDRRDLTRTAFVAACAVAVAAGLTGPGPTVPVVSGVGLVLGCWPILTEAFQDVLHGRMSMEASMLIAIAAAALIGEWTTALVITTFVLAAEILEDLSMDRGRDALTDLMTFLPERVRLREADGVREVALGEVSPRQLVVVSPGGRVPVDGRVVTGHSALDQSRLTGEPLPVDVGPGDAVYAGSVNQVGAIDVRAEVVGEASSYGRIIEAVRQAQSSEPPVQRLADGLAAWLVYLALAGALLTFLLTRDLRATISVVVAGACGVAAGTPLAVLAAIARVARSGAFVKDGAHLEALSGVDTIVLDKTGTLTVGRPSVLGVQPAGGWTGVEETRELLRLAACVESSSEHPLGTAVVEYARERGLAVTASQDFSYEPGRGVSGVVDGHRVDVGKPLSDAPETETETEAEAEAEAERAEAAVSATTPVRVLVDGQDAGSILIADALRPSAGRAVSALRDLGLRPLLLTGDAEPAALAVARELGIEDVRAGLLPHEKLEVIDAEREAGHRLAMVGDGVNDAPALARADVGIAIGSGTQIARESADVILISSDLDDLVETVRTARRARRIIAFNFVGTIAVDLIGMVLASLGLLYPVMAAFVHVGSETAFILNSARLIPGPGAGRGQNAAADGRQWGRQH